MDTGSKPDATASASRRGEVLFLLVSKADPQTPAIKATTIKPRFS